MLKGFMKLQKAKTSSRALLHQSHKKVLLYFLQLKKVNFFPVFSHEM